METTWSLILLKKSFKNARKRAKSGFKCVFGKRSEPLGNRSDFGACMP